MIPLPEINNVWGFMDANILWFLLAFIFCMGVKMQAEWVQSVRSIVTALFAIMFVKLCLVARIPHSDVMLVMSLVLNFYFLVKDRKKGENGNA